MVTAWFHVIAAWFRMVAAWDPYSYSWSRVALRTCSCSSRRRASTAVRATSAETFSAAACKDTRVSE